MLCNINMLFLLRAVLSTMTPLPSTGFAHKPPTKHQNRTMVMTIEVIVTDKTEAVEKKLKPIPLLRLYTG